MAFMEHLATQKKKCNKSPSLQDRGNHSIISSMNSREVSSCEFSVQAGVQDRSKECHPRSLADLRLSPRTCHLIIATYPEQVY